jgi:multisubunit Na+/H+ antiporter MnhG subunit
VTEGLDENTGETLLAVLVMIAVAPFLSHATIRAIRARDTRDARDADNASAGDRS